MHGLKKAAYRGFTILLSSRSPASIVQGFLCSGHSILSKSRHLALILLRVTLQDMEMHVQGPYPMLKPFRRVPRAVLFLTQGHDTSNLTGESGKLLTSVSE